MSLEYIIVSGKMEVLKKGGGTQEDWGKSVGQRSQYKEFPVVKAGTKHIQQY